jgi:hypothetical protein
VAVHIRDINLDRLAGEYVGNGRFQIQRYAQILREVVECSEWKNAKRGSRSDQRCGDRADGAVTSTRYDDLVLLLDKATRDGGYVMTAPHDNQFRLTALLTQELFNALRHLRGGMGTGSAIYDASNRGRGRHLVH